MAAGRDPIDRVVDVLVAVPICSWVAARRAVPLLGRAVRDRMLTIEPPIPVLDEAEIDAVDEQELVEAVATALAGDGPTETVVDVAALPIEDYDHLAARQVVDRLAALPAEDLAVIEQYERAHRHRQTVLRKIEQLTS